MKAVELRQAILQAAVQGKLVPQDLHDEPASELLARIRAEKSALIKEGKIKKEKPLPPIAEDEVPYDLPDGWVWCRLGEIGSWRSGSTPQRGNDKYYKDGTIPWLKTGELNDNFITNSVEKITETALAENSLPLNPPGTLLIAMYGATIGKLGILEIYATTNQACCGCSLASGVELWYLFYYLLAIRVELRKQGAGGAQPNISKEKIVSTLFPLPPLAGQQRIIAKVDELMALCDELEAAEGELETLEKHFSEYLPKSILQHAVQGKLVPQDLHDEPASELLARIRAEKAALIKASKLKKEKPLPLIAEDEIPYDLPDGWVWCRLGSVCDYGTASNAEPDDIPDNSWILELEDIEKETGHLIDIVLKKNRMSKSTKHVFSERNVLYSKLRPYLNKVLVAGQDGYCTSEILPLDFGEIAPSYAVWFLRSPQFVEYANRCSYGVKMPRLGTEDGRMALFPLPPLAEQQRIVAKVDELMALCDELKVAKTLPVAKQAAKIIEFPKPVEPDTKLAFAARGDADNISKEAMDDIAKLLGEFDDD